MMRIGHSNAILNASRRHHTFGGSSLTTSERTLKRRHEKYRSIGRGCKSAQAHPNACHNLAHHAVAIGPIGIKKSPFFRYLVARRDVRPGGSCSRALRKVFFIAIARLRVLSASCAMICPDNRSTGDSFDGREIGARDFCHWSGRNS